MLIIDSVKYEEWIPSSEDEFEAVVKEHTQEIFGYSIYLDRKQKLKSLSGIGSIPDGYVITLWNKPEVQIIELELASHTLQHIVAQIVNIINGIENPATQRKICNAIEDEINQYDIFAAMVAEAIKPTAIHRFLSDSFSNAVPKINIIIDKGSPALEEAINKIVYPHRIIEFRTFIYKTSDKSTHAHLFEPVCETPKIREELPRRGREGGKYHLSTSELLAKYGDRPSNVVGMTWQQLYDGNTDGNFRYFKVRIPLIELDKKETQQEEVV